MKEIWKYIEGYENYMVSNFGNVKGVDRVEKFPSGERKRAGRQLTPVVSTSGYLRVRLYKNDGTNGEWFMAHRLVATTFIPNEHNKPQVNHIDGDKKNNVLENLEWCTRLENQRHAVVNNLYKPKIGESNFRAKLSDAEAKEVKKIALLGDISQRCIAAKFNVSQATVSGIMNGSRRKHLNIPENV